MNLGGRAVGAGSPCFIIAEAGVNHNGSVDSAIDLVEAAVEAGADAVKFQAFSSEQVASSTADLAEYQRQRVASNVKNQQAMLRDLELSPDELGRVAEHAGRNGVLFAATPFDFANADLLDLLNVPFFKVSSGDLTFDPLLEHLRAKGRPIVLSTGMATLDEVEHAVGVIGDAVPIALLHCVSAYPAPDDEINLLAMAALTDRFDLPVGYSDHTIGLAVPFAAVGLGASILEKHLTLDRGLPGPDHEASLDPSNFRALVRGVRTVESSLGSGRKEPTKSELPNRVVSRRSVVATTAIPRGSLITSEVLCCKRPGSGIPPTELKSLIGRRALREFRKDEQLARDGLA